MEITGASYTAVNRPITDGRRALRKLERDRDDAREQEQPNRGRSGPQPQ